MDGKLGDAVGTMCLFVQVLGHPLSLHTSYVEGQP